MMMAKKSGELSLEEIVESLMSRLDSLEQEYAEMKSDSREKFDFLAVKLFLLDPKQKIPDNNTVRKQIFSTTFSQNHFLTDVTERVVSEAGDRGSPELKNQSELIRTLLARYEYKKHKRIWFDVASTPEYGNQTKG
jgi:hypothetical protein